MQRDSTRLACLQLIVVVSIDEVVFVLRGSVVDVCLRSQTCTRMKGFPIASSQSTVRTVWQANVTEQYFTWFAIHE